MNIEELKKMLKHSTTVLLMEQGNPSIVIMSYEDYKKLSAESEQEIKITNSALEAPIPDSVNEPGEINMESIQKKLGEKEAEILERINRDILALKNEIEQEEKSLTID